MSVRQISLLAVDEHVFEFGAQFEWVAIGDDQVGRFADFDAADDFVYAEDLGGINR